MKFNDMSKKQQKEYNKELLEKSELNLDPRRVKEIEDMYPLTAHRAVDIEKKRYDPESLVELLWECGGNMTLAGARVGVTRNTIRTWLEKDGNLKVLDEINESWVDISEEVLREHIAKKKSLDAVKFHLKTKGKDRGYYEKQEHEVQKTIKVRLESDDLPPLPDKDHPYIPDDEFEKDFKHIDKHDDE